MATTSRHHSHPLRTLIIFLAFSIGLVGLMALGGAWTPKLGLDLRGGTTITLTASNTSGQGSVDPASLELARTIIQQRVDSIGVGETEVTTSGDRQIVVSVPNVQQDELVRMVGQTAQLYFRLVNAQEQVAAQPGTQPSTEPTQGAEPSTGPSVAASTEPSASPSTNPRPLPKLPTPVPSPRPTAPGPTPLTTQQVLDWKPSQRDQSDFANFQCGDPFPDVSDQPLITCDKAGTTKFLLSPTVISGSDLVTASAGIPQGQVSWVVNLEFNATAGATFETVTKELATRTTPQNEFAIVLDGKVISYPYVTKAIPGGKAEISGSFNQQSATELANVLKYGALPLAFEVSSVDTVSAKLGGEQLEAGIIAGIIGLVLVVAYSVIYYRALALVVVSSLVIAFGITYAFIVLLGQAMGFALNLPGVAGLIVAIGVTADSFIIYFERIRDEVRDGRTLRTAIEVGWVRSRQTILVADGVSLLSAVVLFILAIGAVKGFAFTLGLTTLIDLAVVFWFTKPLVSVLGRTKYFGEGRRFSGFEPEHLGAKHQPPLHRRPRPARPVAPATKEA
ncbi:protein translocase subunit SecD [Micropruina sp.]|uniref:protein translocase subunit SecD n=1 Tax=Micropruina sp. TaxID=2737536 RepID=UPI00261951C4|nr:protein translocase subunit SecD [Micropruina sp.]